jgi:DNA-binding NarL/FixJ family response regulator
MTENVVRRTRVLIIDDHKVVAEGLARLLRDLFEEVDASTDARLALERITRDQPDIVIVDVSMPHISGLELLRQIRASGARCKVIVLTMHAEPGLAVEALKNGASGFVLKESGGEELVTAVDVVLRGGTYLARDLTKEIMMLMVGAADPARVQLTTQQREIVRLIVSGQRAKEIASTLDLPPRSVETIKYKVMQQLNVHSTAELVRYAIEHQLVTF